MPFRQSALIILVSAVLSGCVGAAYTPTPYDPNVWPYNETQSVYYFTVPNASGVLPCGIFDGRGHGHKIITLSDFPACTAANYTVACLNGEGQWTDQFIREVTLGDEPGTVEYQSSQDGLCAIFPAD